MTTRTKQTVVHFDEPFTVSASSKTLPAGDYRVDHDEQMVEGLTTIAWVRVVAYIHLPAIGSASSKQEMLPIRPGRADAAVWTLTEPA